MREEAFGRTFLNRGRRLDYPTLVIMPVPARAKRKLAAGLGLKALPGWWWADPVTALPCGDGRALSAH